MLWWCIRGQNNASLAQPIKLEKYTKKLSPTMENRLNEPVHLHCTVMRLITYAGEVKMPFFHILLSCLFTSSKVIVRFPFRFLNLFTSFSFKLFRLTLDRQLLIWKHCYYLIDDFMGVAPYQWHDTQGKSVTENTKRYRSKLIQQIKWAEKRQNWKNIWRLITI